MGSQLLYRRSEHLFNEASQSANPRGGAYPREVSNSKFSTPSKIYIARLLGLDVFDPFGDRLGRLRDVVVLKRGLGASIAGARPAKGTEPIVVGIIVEVLGKKRVFMPMTSTWRRRSKETLIVDWDEAVLSTDVEPQAATAFVANHENSKPADLADAIHEMSDKRMVEIAAELQDERLADVLQELPAEDQVQILSHLDDERAAQVLEEMEPDDAADLLIELDDAQREKLLELMEPDEADDVRRLLEYDEGTAGSLMNPVPIILSPEATVAEALAHIRAEEIPPAMAAAVMVTRPPLETPTGKYLGLVHMQKLLRVPPSEPIGHILDTDTEPVSDQASLEELARVLATYDLTIVPIVNESHRLVGAVTIDDVLDALLPEDWRTYDDGTPVRKVGRRFA